MKQPSQLWLRLPNWLRQFIQFGFIGAFATVLDIGLFNVFAASGMESLTAKSLAISIAILFSWLGNRYLTFREHRGNPLQESVKFFIASILGAGIALLCLWVSHYVLGFTSLLADNISANVIGTILGLLFRFVTYKFWVYKPKAD